LGLVARGSGVGRARLSRARRQDRRDPQRCRGRRDHAAPNPRHGRHPYFLSLGRLSPTSSVDRLIDALALAPEPSRDRRARLGAPRGKRSGGRRGARSCEHRVGIRLDASPHRGGTGCSQDARAVASCRRRGRSGHAARGARRRASVVAPTFQRTVSVMPSAYAEAVHPLCTPAADRAELANALSSCLSSREDIGRGARVPSWDGRRRWTLAFYEARARRYSAERAGTNEGVAR